MYMSVFTHVTFIVCYSAIVLMYSLLRQSMKGLPPGCHMYHKLFSILEIITHGKFIKTIYLYSYIS